MIYYYWQQLLSFDRKIYVMILKKYQIVSAQSVYGPLEKQKMFTGCSDAMHRGGIVPNPGQPVSILIKVISLEKN